MKFAITVLLLCTHHSITIKLDRR